MVNSSSFLFNNFLFIIFKLLFCSDYALLILFIFQSVVSTYCCHNMLFTINNHPAVCSAEAFCIYVYIFFLMLFTYLLLPFFMLVSKICSCFFFFLFQLLIIFTSTPNIFFSFYFFFFYLTLFILGHPIANCYLSFMFKLYRSYTIINSTTTVNLS